MAIMKYDKVIIGSGFGGSVAALRISEALKAKDSTEKVLLLERGKDWWGNLTGKPVTEPPFCTYRQPDARAGWMTEAEPVGAPVTFTPSGGEVGFSDGVVNFNSGTYGATPIKKYPGLVEAIPNKNMTVLVGAALGGTSHVYNTFFQQPSSVAFNLAFRDPEFPDDLTKKLFNYATLEPYYQKVTEVISLETMSNAGEVTMPFGGMASPVTTTSGNLPDGAPQISTSLLNTPDYLSTRSFVDQAKELATYSGINNAPLNIQEFSIESIKMAFNWSVVKEEAEAKMLPSATIGEMWYGMNSYSKQTTEELYGVKKSLDQNYLKEANATGNLDIECLSEVTRITMAPNSTTTAPIYHIYVNKINENNVDNPTPFIIEANNIIFSAGSMHTSRLLLESANTSHPTEQCLPKLSSYVGQYWGQNGDIMGTQSVTNRVSSSNGGPGSVDAFFSYVEGVNNEGEDTTTEQQCLDFMKDQNASPFIRFLLYPAWYEESDSLQNTYNMTVCHNTAPGKFVPKPDGSGSYELDYPLTAPIPNSKSSTKNVQTMYTGGVADSANTLVYTLDKWNTANGFTPTEKGVKYSGPMPIKDSTSQLSATHDTPKNNFDVAFGMTAHPLGSCVIGKACDGFGRLKGENGDVLKGLYVVDGSLIPGSTGACTPAWTIAALAEYCMEDIIAKDFS